MEESSLSVAIQFQTSQPQIKNQKQTTQILTTINQTRTQRFLNVIEITTDLVRECNRLRTKIEQEHTRNSDLETTLLCEIEAQSRSIRRNHSPRTKLV